MCRDCVELSVEITYTGEEFGYPDTIPYVRPIDRFNDVRQFIRETIYPHLGWMKSLKSLVLIKLGSLHYSSGIGYVTSFMLDDLLVWLLSEERAPRSLQHLWIQGFDFRPEYESIYFCAPSLKSCGVEACQEDEDFVPFPNLENIAQMRFTVGCPLLHLPNLKYAELVTVLQKI